MSDPAHVIALTGGTGFVGQYVLKSALERGHHVRALVRSPDKVKIQHEKLTLCKGGLGENDAELVHGADFVIHIAGLIKARRREDYLAINADAAGQLALAADKAGVRSFTHISSQAASQPHLSDYAFSKKAGENAVVTAFSRKLKIVRPPAVFGPGDEATKPFFKSIAKGVLPVPGGRGWKQRKISFAYAPDLANLIVDIAAGKAAMPGSNIMTPATVTEILWPEFAELCASAAGHKVRALPIPLSVLYPAAQITSVTSALFGLGHLTRGKLREFLHEDWSSEQLIPGATEPIDALATTLRSYTENRKGYYA